MEDISVMSLRIIAVYVETIFIDNSDEAYNQSMSGFIWNLH